MTDKERNLIDQLMGGTISKEQFALEFNVDSTYVKQLLEVSYDEKNEDDVDFLNYVIFGFNLVTEDYVDLLCRLMYAPWHHQHEDIATIFQSFRFPQTVECLYKTAQTQFEYLEYDDSYALAVKCIWALGDINTEESRKKLELLSVSENEIIRENALKQLQRKVFPED
ncbi:HEAT repeat domain-containing protein [Brevibacterium sp. JNUCC-42]|nr:HEAT repeat domain-containing protein [Brevibacterium sp. JNUCC-42]